MKLLKLPTILLSLGLFLAFFVNKSYATGVLSFTPSNGTVTSEGIYVDVTIANGLESGIEFTVDYTGNITVANACSSGNGKSYVYGCPIFNPISGHITILATNPISPKLFVSPFANSTRYISPTRCPDLSLTVFKASLKCCFT